MTLFTPRHVTYTLFAGTLFLATPQINAHHSSAPHVDRSSSLEISGKVTELKFGNPHAYLYLDVMENGQPVNWRCELSAATILKRRGWSADMFIGGESITVQGSPAWREDHVCLLNSMSIDGQGEISRNETLGESTVALNDDINAPREAYLPNGQPNFSGNWLTKSFGRGSLGVQPDYVPNEAGKKLMASYDMRFDDPVLKCHFVNIFKGWNHDANVNKIEQTDTSVTLTYGFMDAVRVIHLDVDSHPIDLRPSMTGHSIGRWEGDTLVVETTGFEAGALEHATGAMHSDQFETTERFYIDSETGYLVREYSGTDALLAEPATGIDYMALSEEAYTPYGCTELSGSNNVRPEGVDPDTLDGPRTSPMGGPSTSGQNAMAQPQNTSAPAAGSAIQQNGSEGGGWPLWLTIVLAAAVVIGLGGFVKSRKRD